MSQTMKTYLALLGFFVSTSLSCLAQGYHWDYANLQQWVEGQGGGTNQTAEADRIFIAALQAGYGAIVPYHPGITLREIVDETRFEGATVDVLVVRPINLADRLGDWMSPVVNPEFEAQSEDKFSETILPISNPLFEVQQGDLILLFDHSPNHFFDSPPNQTQEPSATVV
jgi:hypothetical protein